MLEPLSTTPDSDYDAEGRHWLQTDRPAAAPAGRHRWTASTRSWRSNGFITKPRAPIRSMVSTASRSALEAASCPCYAITVSLFAKLDDAPPAGTTSSAAVRDGRSAQT